MLLGEKIRNLDGANRILLSRKEREEVGENPFLAMNSEGCLVLCPQRVWESWFRDAEDPQSFRQNSARVEFDRQGRVRIPLFLVRKIGLTKKVLLVGNGDHLKILPIPEQDPREEPENLSQGMRRMKKREEAELHFHSGRTVIYITPDGERVIGKFQAAAGSFFKFVGRDEQGTIISTSPEHFSKFFTGE